MSKTKTPVEDAGAAETTAATAASDPVVETPGDLSSASDAPTPGPVPVDPVTVSPEQLAEAISVGVQKWLAEHCFGTPISRATPALNYLRDRAAPDLTAKILKEVF